MASSYLPTLLSLTDYVEMHRKLNTLQTKGDLFLQFQLDLDPDWIGTKISVPTVVFPRDADKEPFFYIYYPSKSGTSEQFDKMSAAEFIDFLYQC
nr:unnamed protein product [Haemonchus contortus]